ncbi:MAG: hypothetical protein O3C25_00525 [Chloroflexi bacterium]|nr:hypothetical protein [Chloroflexota bacterium]
MADFALQIGLSTMNSQHSQVQAVDDKLWIGGVLAAALLSLLPVVIEASRGPTEESSAARLAALLAAGAFIIALVHSVRGMWARSFLQEPRASEIEDQASEQGYTENDIKWAAAAALKHAIEHNDRVVEGKIASFRTVWRANVAGVLLIAVITVERLLR